MSVIFEKAEAMLAAVQAASLDTPEGLEQFRLAYLGSKGALKDLMTGIKAVANDQKRAYGQLVNAVKQAAETKYAEAKAMIAAQADAVVAIPDLFAPSTPLAQGARHPISVAMNRIVDIFTRIGFTVADEREVEDDWHNFTAMNTPENHPARDMQDTFYLKDSTEMLLRTHTSSVQARIMTTQKPPIRIIAPGRVYRNETISTRSHCQFHQVEGLYVDEGVSFADMKQTLYYFAREMFGADVKIRLRPSFFPFTEPSAEMDIYWGLADEHAHRITKGTGWLEILGCGMVDPAVLEVCGIDPERFTGFAFGMGIERPAMQLYRVNDIRWFFENDIRFLKQFAPAL